MQPNSTGASSEIAARDAGEGVHVLHDGVAEYPGGEAAVRCRNAAGD